MGIISGINELFGNDPNDGTNMLMRFGEALQGPEAQLAANKLRQQKQIQSALSNFSGDDPSALLRLAATIDPAYLDTYANYQSNAPYRQLQAMLLGSQLNNEQVTTNPNGALASFGAPSAMPAPPAAAPPASPTSTAASPQPLYKGGVPVTEGLEKGLQWAINPDGTRIAIPIGGEGQDKGKQRFSTLLRDILQNYKELEKKGDVVSTDANPAANLWNRLAASEPVTVFDQPIIPGGQTFGKAFGTKRQSAINKIQSARPLLSQAIMQATGMGARQLDSNRELQFFIQAITNPSADIESNYEALKRLDELYGTGELSKEMSKPTTPSKKKVIKFEDLP